MSNEYKDWVHDRICDVVIERGLMDKVEEICETPSPQTYVHGWKNGQKVVVVVWFDMNTGEWMAEHREMNY